MRISVLGPLEVTGGDDSPLSIGGPKPKALLTALVARPNVVLPVDTIVDVLWGEQAPLSARTTVRAYMSRMRGVLGTAALHLARRATSCAWGRTISMLRCSSHSWSAGGLKSPS